MIVDHLAYRVLPIRMGLRHLGTGRTRACFFVAPFFNAAYAVPFLDEPVSERILIAGMFMRQSGAQWRAGLAAYRGNGLGHARNALRVQFPTLLAMLGNEAFDTLCTHYWRAYPPRRGDLAWVGEELADFVETLQPLQEWPWLSDCARLDWAVWQTASAAPARLGEKDLRRLAAGDPRFLRLQLADSVHRVPSVWPVVTLFMAHRAPDPDWIAVSQLLERRQAETALVWRQPEHLSSALPVLALDEITDRWIAALHQATTIETALDQAGDNFDFAAWLELGVQQGWLDAVTDIHST